MSMLKFRSTPARIVNTFCTTCHPEWRGDGDALSCDVPTHAARMDMTVSRIFALNTALRVLSLMIMRREQTE